MNRNAIFDKLVSLAIDSDGIERSWSISKSHTVEERFLLFFSAIDDRANRLARCAEDLGAPRHMVAAWQDLFADADAIGLALNTSGSSVRLYVQYWDRLAQRVNQGDLSPFPLYIGLKSLPDSSLRQDVYICLPMAGPQVFWPPIAKAFADLGLPVAAAPEVLPDLNEETCIFTGIDGAARHSWLATVRRADPRRADFASALATAFTEGNAWQTDLLAQARTYDLLHIAGGQDPLKGDFTTLYFTSDLAQFKAAFAPQYD